MFWDDEDEELARRRAEELDRIIFDSVVNLLGLPVGDPEYAGKTLLEGVDVALGGPVARTVMDVEPVSEAEPYTIADRSQGSVRGALEDVGGTMEKALPGGYSPEDPGSEYGPPPFRKIMPVVAEYGLYGGVARGIEGGISSVLKHGPGALKFARNKSLEIALERNPQPPAQLYSMAPGALLGLEEDERGNLTFNPEKAVLGIAAAATAGGLAARIGITKRGRGGRFMRGKLSGKHPATEFAKAVDEQAIHPPWDLVENASEARQVAKKMKWKRPTVEETRYPLRYRKPDPQTGAYGNVKMKYPSEAFPQGRNTWEKSGCGRAEYIHGNRLEMGENPLGHVAEQACYGGACYAEVPRYGRSAARSSARVSTKLQPAKGQDIRLGVDTDGSAWLAEKPVLDAMLEVNPRTITVYSSAHHRPPPRHPLSRRTIVNVTVSGWHQLPETMKRLEWAHEARKNGWNVILREVTADPNTFVPLEAAYYNRFRDAFRKTDFFIMEQPLHRGAAYGKPLEYPACCTAEKRLHTCDSCEVTEGLGRGFQQHWGIKEEPGEYLIPDVTDYTPQRSEDWVSPEWWE